MGLSPALGRFRVLRGNHACAPQLRSPEPSARAAQRAALDRNQRSPRWLRLRKACTQQGKLSAAGKFKTFQTFF